MCCVGIIEYTRLDNNMHLRAIKTYQKKTAKTIPSSNQNVQIDNCSIFENSNLDNLIDRNHDISSPEVLGVDWNDTFDRLLNEKSRNKSAKESVTRKSLIKLFGPEEKENTRNISGGGEYIESNTIHSVSDINCFVDQDNTYNSSSCYILSNSDVNQKLLNFHETNKSKPIACSTPARFKNTVTVRNKTNNSIENKINPFLQHKEESIVNADFNDINNLQNFKRPRKSINILPGKKWRRSLSLYIHSKSIQEKVNVLSVCEEQKSCDLTNAKEDYKRGCIDDNVTNTSIVNKQLSYISISSDELEYSAKSNDLLKSTAKSQWVLSGFSSCTDSLQEYDSRSITAYEVVLRRCGQTSPLPFNECYPDEALKKCHKIGEGLFGEVYLYKDLVTKECSVLKVIPIEGKLLVNGEKQKKFSEILSEVIIVMELSNLRSNEENNTSGFSKLKKISCVRGKYPEVLLDLWELYDEQYGSENDNPQVFGDDQLYIVLELGNGGRDFEAFKFTNAKQSLSIFRQVALSLAVAEKSLEFEHRDLHWGNVLVVPTVEKYATFTIDGQTITLPLCNVKATIIDFTFSRITIHGEALYSDLGADEELFTAVGDYQFEIYRQMQKYNNNDWKSFQPYSNILWLHYLCDKMLNGARYTCPKSKVHKINEVELQLIKDSLLSYKSANEFVEDFNYFV